MLVVECGRYPISGSALSNQPCRQREVLTVDGDTITLIGDWRSTHANGRSSFAFEVDGDKLKSMTIREG